MAILQQVATTPIEIKAIIQGIFVGIVMALAGYAKTTTPEEFDFGKFFTTVVVGGLSGLFTLGLGMSPENFQTWLTQSGIVIWIEYIIKIFIRRLK